MQGESMCLGETSLHKCRLPIPAVPAMPIGEFDSREIPRFLTSSGERPERSETENASWHYNKRPLIGLPASWLLSDPLPPEYCRVGPLAEDHYCVNWHSAGKPLPYLL